MSFLSIFKKKTSRKHAGALRKLSDTEIYVPRIATETKCEVSVNERVHLVLSGIMTGGMIGHPYKGLSEIPSYIDPDVYPLIGANSHISGNTVLSYAVTQTALEISGGFPMVRETRVNLYRSNLKKYAKAFSEAGYGIAFYNWAIDDGPDYASYGNGGAARAGVIGAVFDDVSDVIENAICSALPSHGHPEGIKGAVVAAILVWMAFHGATRMEILSYACKHYSEGFWDAETYQKMTPLDPGASIEDIKELAGATTLRMAWITVPEAVVNFMHSNDFDSCMRNILRYASDSDTVGAISGAIAAAYYKNCTLTKKEDEVVATENRKAAFKNLKAVRNRKKN